MDYLATFDISASGMAAQKLKLDTVALNLANASTTQTAAGGPYRRQHVILGERVGDASFQAALLREQGSRYGGVEVVQIQEDDSPPRLVFEPGHPESDERGFVAYPNVDVLAEMVVLLAATRLYEANVRVLSAARAMALRALDI